jgi:hypothetical protein
MPVNLPAWASQLDDALSSAITDLETAEWVIRAAGGNPTPAIAAARRLVEQVRHGHRDAMEIPDVR